jgi:hypothetical protein
VKPTMIALPSLVLGNTRSLARGGFCFIRFGGRAIQMEEMNLAKAFAVDIARYFKY